MNECDECGTPASDLTEVSGICEICRAPFGDEIDIDSDRVLEILKNRIAQRTALEEAKRIFG